MPSGPDPKSEQLPSMFGIFPVLVPFSLHGLADGGFGRGYECLRRLRLLWWFGIRSCVWAVANGFFRGSVGCFIAWHAGVCRYPSEPNLQDSTTRLTVITTYYLTMRLNMLSETNHFQRDRVQESSLSQNGDISDIPVSRCDAYSSPLAGLG